MGVSTNGDKPLIYPNSWMLNFISFYGKSMSEWMI